MDLTALREWLIANGIPSEELDNVEPATIKIDTDNLGGTAVMALKSLDDLAGTLVMALMQIDELKAEISALKGGAA